jgi:hypothetical protein
MKALPYLFFTTLKNRIISFFKKPSNWIVALLVAAMLGLVIFAGGKSVNAVFRPIEELHAIVSVLYIAMFAFSAYRGVNRGTTLFSLADIHLLFPAPLKPQKILLYGLVKQMGTSLMVGFFLLFQYAWIHQQYGVPLPFLLAVLLGYGITLFLGQLTAMTMYGLTHLSEKKRKAAKTVLLSLCGLAALYVLLPVFFNSSVWMQVGSERLSRLPMLLFPVGGWMRALVEGIWEAKAAQIVWSLGAAIAWTAAGIVLLGREQTDYYEDVLKATETLHQTIALKREGKMQEVLPENVKVGKTGINRGFGASVFYYKHRLESRRARRFLLDTISMIMLLVSLAFAFIMRGEGLLPAFAFATYMQLFTVSSGRWVKELSRPYIYMVPETSFRKLIHCLRESILGFAAEALLLMIPMGLILKVPPLEIAFMILARISFSLLFVAGNLLLEKLFSGMKVKALVIMLYFLVMIILILPGIVLSIVLYSLSVLFLSVNITVLAVLTFANLIIAPLIFFLCRNILNNPEWISS